MADDHFRLIELHLSIDEFHRLPQNSAYKYEYFNSRAVLSPRPKCYRAVLDLQPMTDVEPCDIRPLPPGEIVALAPLFRAAFHRTQPFAALDDAEALTAARQCLGKTAGGGDGPPIGSACTVAILNGAAVGAQDAYPKSIPTPDGAPRAKYERLEVAGRDGTKLVVHEWAPAKASAGKPAILFVHGIGFHGEPHASIEAGFTARGLVFCAIDLRGHGRSGGNPGELAEPQVLRADLGAAMGLIAERHRDAPIVLCGESLGGLIAADYAWRGERRLAGLALLVPAFAVHKSQVKLEGIAAALSGRVAIATDAKLSASTRVEGFARARKADKLALREVKVPYLTATAAMQLEWPRAAADLKLPLFIGVAGKDRIVDSRAARAVYDSAGTPQQDRTWRQWDDACHTLCWDPLTPEIVGELASWALGLVEKTLNESGKWGKCLVTRGSQY